MDTTRTQIQGFRSQSHPCEFVLMRGQLSSIEPSLPVMRLVEPVGVTVLEGQVPTLLFAGPLLLEIFLSHHVQLSVGRQLCPRRRLLSRLLPDCISRPLSLSSAVSRAMSVERGHAAHDERRRSHHHKKTHWFELSGHNSTPDLIPGEARTQSEP